MNPFDWLYCIGLAVALAVSQATPRQIADAHPLGTSTSAGALLIEEVSK
ncbi:hypothetical protein [Pseudomonas syringae group genomosp. 3]|nr:hypothetical protein [Pseudomonas syringae group genomosp. 3]